MRKNILVLIVALLSVNISRAQFICKISPEVKELGDLMTKVYKPIENDLIVGDYRENGTGWILLPNHTGAVFSQNKQTNELLWVLENIKGSIGIEIDILKKEAYSNNELQVESQIKYLVNIKSEMKIELINPQTFKILNLKRTKQIPNNVYSQINNIKEKYKKNKKSFSVFAKKYVDEQVVAWQKKGEFEKTLDWQLRVNDETTRQKIEDCNLEAIDAYAESLHIKLGFCYIGASLSLCHYDADKEIYIIKSDNFGDLQVPVPFDKAEKFKNQDWCGNNSHPTNIIYYIIDDEIGLAQATFLGGYKYENPLAKNRKKTKTEIAIESLLKE